MTSIATIAACSASSVICFSAADGGLELPIVIGFAHLTIALLEVCGQIIRGVEHHGGAPWALILGVLAVAECIVVAFTLFMLPSVGVQAEFREALKVAWSAALTATVTGALIATSVPGGVLAGNPAESALFGARTGVIVLCAAVFVYLHITWRRQHFWTNSAALVTALAVAAMKIARTAGSAATWGPVASAVGHYVYSAAYGAACFLAISHVIRHRRDQLRHALHVSERDRRRLLNRLVTVQDETSVQVSNELHGQVGQSLVMLLGQLNPDRHGAADAEERLRDARHYALEALDGVRQVARLVRSAALGDVSLSTAVETFVAEFSRSQGLRGSVEVIGSDDGTLSPAVKNALHFGIRESVANIARHSAATDFSVVLSFRGDNITATIDDNGHGFDVAKTPPGLGQIGTAERLDSVGGTVSIESSDRGTTIILRAPRKE